MHRHWTTLDKGGLPQEPPPSPHTHHTHQAPALGCHARLGPHHSRTLPHRTKHQRKQHLTVSFLLGTTPPEMLTSKELRSRKEHCIRTFIQLLLHTHNCLQTHPRGSRIAQPSDETHSQIESTQPMTICSCCNQKSTRLLECEHCQLPFHAECVIEIMLCHECYADQKHPSEERSIDSGELPNNPNQILQHLLLRTFWTSTKTTDNWPPLQGPPHHHQ